jgi:hypothetical protein
MILKYLMPYTAFTLVSPLTLGEARLRLKDVTEPRKLRLFDFGIFDSENWLFAGKIDGVAFYVTRPIIYSNSFPAVAVGRFEATPKGCKIHIHIRLMIPHYVACLAWLAAVVVYFRTILSDAVLNGNVQSLMVLLSLLILALAPINGSFWLQANKQKRMLAGIFEIAA